jgi:hypothetical protein
MSFILFFVNFAMTQVILIFNAQALIVTFLVPNVCIVMTRLLSITMMSLLCSWGCEEISRKTSLVDMSVCDINRTLRGCHLYCVKDCLANTYIQNLIKHDVLPSYDRTYRCFYLINREDESSKVSSVVPVSKPDYVEKMPFKPLPPKGESKKSKKKKRSKRREGTVSSPKHVAPIIDYDNSNLDDVLMPVTYVSDHDWEKKSTFDIENLFGTNSEKL